MMKMNTLLLLFPILVSSYYICGHYDRKKYKTLWKVNVGEILEINGGFFEERGCFKLPKFLTSNNGIWYAAPQEEEAMDYYLLWQRNIYNTSGLFRMEVHNVSNQTAINAVLKNTSIVLLDKDPTISPLDSTTLRTEILETEIPPTPEPFTTYELFPIESDDNLDLLQELNLFVETPKIISLPETPPTPMIPPPTITKGRMTAVLLASIFVLAILLTLGYYGYKLYTKKLVGINVMVMEWLNGNIIGKQ